MQSLNQNSWCTRRDSNRTPPEYKREALPFDLTFSVHIPVSLDVFVTAARQKSVK
jgi:hypothetical protein